MEEYWSGLPFPSPGDLSDPGIEHRSPALQADSLPTELQGKPLPKLKICILSFSLCEAVLARWFSSRKSACNAGDTGMATYSSILAQKIPWTRGTWWVTVHGVAKGANATEWLNNNFFFHSRVFIKNDKWNREKIFSESCPGSANLSIYALFVWKMIIPWKLEWIMEKLETALKLEWVFLYGCQLQWYLSSNKVYCETRHSFLFIPESYQWLFKPRFSTKDWFFVYSFGFYIDCTFVLLYQIWLLIHMYMNKICLISMHKIYGLENCSLVAH